MRAVTLVPVALPVSPEGLLDCAGLTRAGWYSYDLLDNFGRNSAYRIIPELRDIKPGDVIRRSPDGKKGMLVDAIDPPHSMVWSTPASTSWTWLLESRSDGTTRVITRVRSRYQWFSPSIVFSALVEFADIWMMRRMLLNIRGRVEAGTNPTDEFLHAARPTVEPRAP